MLSIFIAYLKKQYSMQKTHEVLIEDTKYETSSPLRLQVGFFSPTSLCLQCSRAN